MLRVRAVNEVDDFVDPEHDPDEYPDTIRSLWEQGSSRPEWCFVAVDDGTRVGRVGFRTEPTTSDPAWLGTLPPLELSVFGLGLDWNEPETVGRALLQEAAGQIAGSVPDTLEVRIIEGIHDHAEARCRVAEAAGMHLFAEKLGYEWLDDGSALNISDRLNFRSVDDIGVDAYRR